MSEIIDNFISEFENKYINIKSGEKIKFFNYQRNDIVKILSKRMLNISILLAYDTGVGKTLCSILIILFCVLYDMKMIFRPKRMKALVVVLKSIIEDPWCKEFKNYYGEDFQSKVYVVPYPDCDIVNKCTLDTCEIAIIPYDTLACHHRDYAETKRKEYNVFDHSWSIIVADEPQEKFKNGKITNNRKKGPESYSNQKVANAIYSLRRQCGNEKMTEYALALSATPIDNTIAQIASYSAFLNPQNTLWTNPQFWTALYTANKIDKIVDEREKFIIFRSAESVSNERPAIIPKREHTVLCRMTSEQVKCLRSMAKREALLVDSGQSRQAIELFGAMAQCMHSTFFYAHSKWNTEKDLIETFGTEMIQEKKEQDSEEDEDYDMNNLDFDELFNEEEEEEAVQCHIPNPLMRKWTLADRQSLLNTLNYDRIIKSSGKYVPMLEIIKQKFEESSTNRVVIFVNWIHCIYLIKCIIQHFFPDQEPLIYHKSGLKQKDLNNLIKLYDQKLPQNKILIVCTHALKVGVSLVSANVGIIMDPCMNPNLELQLTARLHRPGQVQQVDIYRMLIDGDLSVDIHIRDNIQNYKVTEIIPIANPDAVNNQYAKLNTLKKRRFDQVKAFCSEFKNDNQTDYDSTCQIDVGKDWMILDTSRNLRQEANKYKAKRKAVDFSSLIELGKRQKPAMGYSQNSKFGFANYTFQNNCEKYFTAEL
jgi:SNF2 family DNA or RNA helicase